MGTTDALLAAATPISGLSQIAARAAFAGALVSLLALLSLHVLKPELEPSWHMVSEYAVGTHGWVMTLCFAGLVVGCVGLVVALLPQQPSILAWIGILLLLVAAVGLSMGALFPTDPITVAPENASPTARLHALAVLIGNPPFLLAALLLLIAIWGNGVWDTVRLPLLILTVLIWLSLAAMIAIAAILLPRNGGFGPAVMIGWPNRVLMLSYAGWLMAAALPLAWGRVAG